MKRIIIAGGRDFSDYELLSNEVTSILEKFQLLPSEIEIIEGDAKGADKLGGQYANESGLQLSVFPAEWDRLGTLAGYIRNNLMAEYASEGSDKGVLIAFWNGRSRGTKHMMEQAGRYGLDTYIIPYEKET